MDEQSCISCGRSTAPGSRLFASRKRGVDKLTGVRGFLCHACQPGSAKPGSEHSIPVSGRYAVIDIPGYPG